jgi:hypothetical protein
VPAFEEAAVRKRYRFTKSSALGRLERAIPGRCTSPSDRAVCRYDYRPEPIAGPLRREHRAYRSRLVNDHRFCSAGTAAANRWLHDRRRPPHRGTRTAFRLNAPDGDEFFYLVNETMELILDGGDERAASVETRVVLRSGDAYIVPRGVWLRLESVEPSYLVHVTPGPNGSHRPRRTTA